jgi:hypothetical protein
VSLKRLIDLSPVACVIASVKTISTGALGVTLTAFYIGCVEATKADEL